MLVYEEYITENKEAFVAKVKAISAELGFNPNWLMTVMKSESGLNHRIPNSIGCAGLIQFCPPTPQSFGTSVQALIEMSNVEQLDYVYKFYKYHKDNTLRGGTFKSAFDLYLCTFYPVALTRDDDFVLGSEQSDSWARTVAAQNAPFDLNKDGYIHKYEFRKWFNDKYGRADGTWSNYIEVQTKKVLKPKVFVLGGVVVVGFSLAYFAYKSSKKKNGKLQIKNTKSAR